MHVITSLGAGGAQRQLQLLVSALKGESDQGVVSLTSGGLLGELLRDEGIGVCELRMSGWIRLHAVMTSLRAQIHQFRPDVVHAWMYHANLLTSIALLGSRHLHNLIWGVRTSLEEDQLRPRTQILARVSAWASGVPQAIVYNSQSGARSHEALGYRAERTVVIPNGVDTIRFQFNAESRAASRAKLGIAGNSFVIGMAARFDRAKDHRTLLTALRLLVDRGVDAYVVLCGDQIESANSSLTSLISRCGVGDRAVLLGDRADMQTVMAGWDVACLATLREAFPNAVVEAMSCERPCVASDVGDVALIIGDAGLVVPPGDPQKLADALERIAHLPGEARCRMGTIGRHRVTERFSLPAMVARYKELYAACVARRPSRR